MNGHAPATGGPVAIICGGGSLPLTVADAIERGGRRVVLFPIRGWADPATIGRFPHHWLFLATIGRFRRLALKEGCRDVVLIGNALRPALRELRFDWMTVRMLPSIMRMYKGGDDRLLTGRCGNFRAAGLSSHRRARIGP